MTTICKIAMIEPGENELKHFYVITQGASWGASVTDYIKGYEDQRDVLFTGKVRECFTFLGNLVQDNMTFYSWEFA